MTRVIAGTAGGYRLQVPPGVTRPTSERAREGLFNSVAARLDLDGARVLDLFAGSGAVGLEALSRGAELAVLVESDRAACRIIAANADGLRDGRDGLGRADVVCAPAAAFLGRAQRDDEVYDLIFADPPYAMNREELDEVLAGAAVRARPGALLVVERAARGAPPRWPAAVAELQHRRYGEAMLWYGRRE